MHAETSAEHEEHRRGRQQTSDDLLNSDSRTKLVVAGPGTGKTHNFRRVLERAGGGLALTFIRALAQDLDRDLGDLAQVNTFHGFCKHLAHKLDGVGGLSKSFDYYPDLPMLMADDLAILDHADATKDAVERAFRLMDDSDGLVTAALDVADYYDAASHNDIVYRVERHLAANPGDVPEFPVVVVDEYQDFNLLETRLIDALAQRNPVLIAGDDDQALYAFKDASPRFIRELAEGSGIDRFDLPYCSRCTEVVVAAVNELVKEAQAQGKLQGRIDRPYLCYLPDKQEDSDAYPALIHAACSFHRKENSYIARYVAEQVAQIPEVDVAASREKGHPTALIMGPRHWVRPVFEHLTGLFADVRFQESSRPAVKPLDGYRRLARRESSRLGWRILLHTDPCDGAADVIATALDENHDISELIPSDWRDRHVTIAQLVKKLLDEEDLDADEESTLTAELTMDIEAIKADLQIAPDEEDEPNEESRPDDGDGEGTGPSILCTTLVGAKGLSAEHVFIVGFVDGLLPHDASDVTDTEICELIVGLSRTRQACHLISCTMWSGQFFQPSAFLNWLDDIAIDEITVNKDYW